jgi:hypothetical protein
MLTGSFSQTKPLHLTCSSHSPSSRLRLLPRPIQLPPRRPAVLQLLRECCHISNAVPCANLCTKTKLQGQWRQYLQGFHCRCRHHGHIQYCHVLSLGCLVALYHIDITTHYSPLKCFIMLYVGGRRLNHETSAQVSTGVHIVQVDRHSPYPCQSRHVIHSLRTWLRSVSSAPSILAFCSIYLIPLLSWPVDWA